MKFAILSVAAATASATKFWNPKKVISMEDWGFPTAPSSTKQTNMASSQVGSSGPQRGISAGGVNQYGQQGYQQQGQYGAYGQGYDQYGGYGGAAYGQGYDAYGGAYGVQDPFAAQDPYAVQGAYGGPGAGYTTPDLSGYGADPSYGAAVGIDPVYGDAAPELPQEQSLPTLPVIQGGAGAAPAGGLSQADIDSISASIVQMTETASALESRIAALEGKGQPDGYNFDFDSQMESNGDASW